MSRTLKMSAEVPESLCRGVGAIVMLREGGGEDELMEYPEISLPGQYQAALVKPFEPEKYFGGKPQDFYGSPDDGVAHLNHWNAAEAAAMLRRVISRIPDEAPTGNFWDATPGNVRALLGRILGITEWAEKNAPEASWYLCCG